MNLDMNIIITYEYRNPSSSEGNFYSVCVSKE